MAVFLCATALAGCSSVFGSADASKDKPAVVADKTPVADKSLSSMAADLEGNLRQAQTLRTAGQYDDAIHIVSQLMLVNSDDPRVVSEYGKVLAMKGRAKDATDFLNRAIELSSNDWTLYSALGVSYDQLGNQTSARAAYEHALILKPNEPSVLNNYALSRMMADDAPGARALIARAQAAGGASDAKIAANIAMINNMAVTKPEASVAAPKTTAAIAPVQAPVQNASAPAAKPVATASLPPAQNTPHPLVPSSQPTPANNGVVMQAVPVDPLAGPVKTASHKPAKTDSAKKDAAKTDTAKDSKTADAQVAKPADTKPAASPAPQLRTAAKSDSMPALRLTADALTP